MIWDKLKIKHLDHSQRVGNFSKIIVPTFGIPEDKQALKYIRKANPGCVVRGFRMRDIAKEGGALHCITWNIKI